MTIGIWDVLCLIGQDYWIGDNATRVGMMQ